MKVYLLIFLILFETLGINLDFLDEQDFFNLKEKEKQTVDLPEVNLTKISAWPAKKEKADSLPALQTKSYYLFDLDSQKVLAGKKINKKRSIASLTKIMTAVVALENMDLEKTVEIDKKALDVTGSRLWIEEGMEISVEELLRGTLIKSANDCAKAVEIAYDKEEGKGEFVKLMNKKAETLNMKDTKYVEATGLNEKNVSTADNLKNLANYILKSRKLRKIIDTYSTKITTENGYYFPIYSTNRMLRKYDDMFGIKTGYLEEAGQCFIGASRRNNHSLIVIILGAGDNNSRFLEARKLLNWGFNNYNW